MELKVGENFITNYEKRLLSANLENNDTVVKKIFFRQTSIIDDNIADFYRSFGKDHTILTSSEGDVIRCLNTDVIVSKNTDNTYDIEVTTERIKIR